MQSQSTPASRAEVVSEIIYDVCPECGRFAALRRRTEDGLIDELDQFWTCESCQTPVIYDTEDGVPF